MKLQIILLVAFLSLAVVSGGKEKSRQKKRKEKLGTALTKMDTLPTSHEYTNGSACQLVVNFCPQGRTIVNPWEEYAKMQKEVSHKKNHEQVSKDDKEEYDDDNEDDDDEEEGEYDEYYDDPYNLFYLTEDITSSVMDRLDGLIEKKIQEVCGGNDPDSSTIHLSFSPSADPVMLGLTKTFAVNCSVPKSIASGKTQVLSISIEKHSGNSVEKVALVAEGHDPVLMDAQAVQVEGVVSDTQSSHSFLAVSWLYPDHDIEGVYVCQARVLDKTSGIEVLEQTILVSAESSREIEQLNSSLSGLFGFVRDQNKSHMEELSALAERMDLSIFELFSLINEQNVSHNVEISAVTRQVNSSISLLHSIIQDQHKYFEHNVNTVDDKITKGLNQLEGITRSHTKKVMDLNKEMKNINVALRSLSTRVSSADLETRHIEMGEYRCEFYKKQISQIVNQISFERVYTHPPMVFLSMTLLDFYKDTNLRTLVKAENVTTHGFKLFCETWADTRGYKMDVSWLSIGK